MRNLLTSLALAAAASLAFAGPTPSAPLPAKNELAFVRYRRPDGTMYTRYHVPLGGPIHLQRVNAQRMSPFAPVARPHKPAQSKQSFYQYLTHTPFFATAAAQLPPPADTVVYNSDLGTGTYAIIDPSTFPSPSILDDIGIINSGVNKPWTKLSFALDNSYSGTSTFLVHIWFWQTHVANPAPQNCYTDYIWDIGWIFSPSSVSGYGGPGTYMIPDLPVNSAPITATSSPVYVAVQFRDTSDLVTGMGPFVDVSNVFSVDQTGVAPLPVGTSNPTFIFDNDPLDGNYNDNELDELGDSTGANLYPSYLYLKAKVASTGSTFTLLPSTFTQYVGKTTNGDVTGAWYAADGATIASSPAYTVARGVPNIGDEFVTPVPGTYTPSSISFHTIGITSAGPLQQTIWLYDWVNSNWVQLNQQLISTPGAFETNTGYGGTLPITNFLNASRQVKGRIGYLDTTSKLARWNVQLDLFNTIVTKN